MEAVAKHTSIPMSVRKMRLLVDLIRGKQVGEALDILKYSKQEASRWLEKTLVCAVANWEYKLGGTESADDYGLVISETFANSGAQLKRFRPAPHGRAHRVRKHSCHISIKVANTKPLADEGVDAEVAETNQE